jgi:hypothetical protein
MPYIKQSYREAIKELHIEDFVPNGPGELQYVIALFVEAYMDTNGISYQKCNDMLGALSGAHAEFYRKVVAPYEDKKIQENGHIYRLHGYENA